MFYGHKHAIKVKGLNRAELLAELYFDSVIDAREMFMQQVNRLDAHRVELWSLWDANKKHVCQMVYDTNGAK